MKEEEPGKYVYIILRGMGVESCSSQLSHLAVTKGAG